MTEPNNQPVNHMLVLGANRELAAYAAHPQRLIEQVQRAEGLSFIAHPFDRLYRRLMRMASSGTTGL
jgi:hypothetical protein